MTKDEAFEKWCSDDSMEEKIRATVNEADIFIDDHAASALVRMLIQTLRTGFTAAWTYVEAAEARISQMATLLERIRNVNPEWSEEIEPLVKDAPVSRIEARLKAAEDLYRAATALYEELSRCGEPDQERTEACVDGLNYALSAYETSGGGK